MRKISDIQNDILKLEDELSATIKDQKGKFFKNKEETSFFICLSASVEEGITMQVLDINSNHKVIFKKEKASFDIIDFDLLEISENEFKESIKKHFSMFLDYVVQQTTSGFLSEDISDNLKDFPQSVPTSAEELGEFRRLKQEEGYRYLRNKKK